ncbi:hypothetical protein [Escherichia coli]|uniref:hypothetical protein n=1 Tax=Escherichia coli TaxID=562 RepID=UPI0030085210
MAHRCVEKALEIAGVDVTLIYAGANTLTPANRQRCRPYRWPAPTQVFALAPGRLNQQYQTRRRLHRQGSQYQAGPLLHRDQKSPAAGVLRFRCNRSSR